ncbi:hypothetical protein Cfor_09840, partial [Coptotermes formosanus]
CRQFWKCWYQDHLQELQQRRCWRFKHPDVKRGDVVIIHEDNLPPLKWLLGAIEEVFTGSDGHVRVVLVCIKRDALK